MPKEYEIPSIETGPSGGWKYTQPESGKTFEHYDHETWLRQIQDHRLGNGYPISHDWIAQLHDEACKQNPHWQGKTCRRIVGNKPTRRALSFAAALSFLKMLTKWALDGAKLEDQEEAERRAAICAGCPYNVTLSFGCGACMSTVLAAIKGLLGKRATTQDKKLGACGICSCSLKASVWFPASTQFNSLDEDTKDQFRKVEFCWKRGD